MASNLNNGLYDVLTNICNNKLFMFIHLSIYMILIFSPLFITKKIKKKYGQYIFLFMFCVIISWIIFGKCPLSQFEKSHEKGLLYTVLKTHTGIDITKYNTLINFIFTILYTLSAYFYSKYNNNVLYFIIFFNIYYLYDIVN